MTLLVVTLGIDCHRTYCVRYDETCGIWQCYKRRVYYISLSFIKQLFTYTCGYELPYIRKSGAPVLCLFFFFNFSVVARWHALLCVPCWADVEECKFKRNSFSAYKCWCKFFSRSRIMCSLLCKLTQHRWLA